MKSIYPWHNNNQTYDSLHDDNIGITKQNKIGANFREHQRFTFLLQTINLTNLIIYVN